MKKTKTLFRQEVDLVFLALTYLRIRQRITHKDYTFADLFETCEKVLQFSEHKGKYKTQNSFKFKNECLLEKN